MNVTGVDFVCVPTQNWEQSKDFYGDTLGLERSKQWGEMPASEFETGSLTIALMQSDAFGIEFAPHSLPIALHVDDVHEGPRGPRGQGRAVRRRHARQRRLPHGPLPGPRRQRPDAALPLRAQGREAGVA